jgi:hypothetical protein
MGRKPDFIGLGAQKAGTSWIYACLYEHPQICIPLKEIHFFSRQRNWSNGYEWYEKIFEQCSQDTKTGEFSTSYLVEPVVPERIHRRYPSVKLIASLRNPIDRTYSNYLNDVKSGVVPRNITFEEGLKSHPEYVEQGCYATQLRRYLQFFSRAQILLLVYEDCLHQPLEFIQSIYRFLDVDSGFVPSMLHKKVNVSKVPRFVVLERCLITISEFLHSKGFHHVWWFAKKIGVANFIRKLNTRQSKSKNIKTESPPWRELVYTQLEGEIKALETIIERDLHEWHI